MVKPNRKTRASTLNRWQQKCIAPPANKVWARLYLDTFDSEPWRDLTINARRVLDALICHHFRHAQQENGKLEISYSGFQRAGVSNRDYVGPSIEALVEAGMLNITCKSAPSRRYGLLPNTYAITMYRGDVTTAGLIQKANRPFVWIPVEVLESRAWYRMSLNEHRMLDRLLIENIRYRSEHNGSLRVSYAQFEALGIGHRFIATTARELVASGLLAISKGRRRGILQPPNIYRITFLGTVGAPATWRPENETSSGKEALTMQDVKNFSLVPKGAPGLVPKGAPGLVPKGAPT